MLPFPQPTFEAMPSAPPENEKTARKNPEVVVYEENGNISSPGPYGEGIECKNGREVLTSHVGTGDVN